MKNKIIKLAKEIADHASHIIGTEADDFNEVAEQDAISIEILATRIIELIGGDRT